MANHVTNKLRFAGKESKVKEMLNSVKGIKCDFDIDSFYPVPEELKNTVSPTRIVSNEELKKRVNKRDRGELTDYELQCMPMTESRSKQLIKNYGADNWFDWCSKNWGTKWGAYDVEKCDDTFEFLTAWRTPMPAMIVLSKMHPEVELSVRYFDEDFGCNVGEYKILAGKIIYLNQPEGFTEESYRLAMDIDDNDGYYADTLLNIDEDEGVDDNYATACIKLVHEKGILYYDFPIIVLDKLLEYAIADEKYERANTIKKYKDNLLAK